MMIPLFRGAYSCLGAFGVSGRWGLLLRQHTGRTRTAMALKHTHKKISAHEMLIEIDESWTQIIKWQGINIRISENVM